MTRSVKSVLIVEDDPKSRLALKVLLESYRFRSFEAGTVKEAIYHLYNHERPDLILLDLCLPEKDGVQFNTELKGNRLFSRIPVIVTSAHIDDSLDQSKFAGVFSKPIDTEALMSLISKILQSE